MLKKKKNVIYLLGFGIGLELGLELGKYTKAEGAYEHWGVKTKGSNRSQNCINIQIQGICTQQQSQIQGSDPFNATLKNIQDQK